MNGEAVYSPQLFFKGACNSIKTGVCRHHSTYLVALLIELGVPQNHLRLIGLEGHMVMGILIEGSSGRWHYYDPTAISSNYYTHEFQLPSVFEELELLPLDF